MTIIKVYEETRGQVSLAASATSRSKLEPKENLSQIGIVL